MNVLPQVTTQITGLCLLTCLSQTPLTRGPPPPPPSPPHPAPQVRTENIMCQQDEGF